MSSLGYLQSLLSNLIAKKRKAEADLKIQKKKQSQIQGIIFVLSNQYDDDADRITRKVNDTTMNILDGIKASNNMVIQSNEVSEEKEYFPESDSNLSASLSNLNSELAEVARKIAELEQEIKNLSIQISDTQDAIEAEKRRLEEERREAERREAERREAEREAARNAANNKKV